ncbi:VTC domain-containing protein [Candidatus Pelagibacter sp.]|nr:VTC domain-containing protein [Candidatus Pelagibacter sp.]MDC0642202.1 VTC domain-containing protein [Candidatus Pelagibacter sp.]
MNFKKNLTRRELKYKVFYKDIGKLFFWLLNSPFKKSFENRHVNSLYYDTPNLDFAYDNISGESKRIKIRTRWYTKNYNNFFDSFSEENQSFNIEIKRKKNNLSNKIVIPNIYFENKDSFKKRKNILKEKLFSEISNYSELCKIIIDDVLFVGYDREYYENFASSKIRLTIDKNITCSKSQIFSNLKKTLISKNYIIVELKFLEDSFKNVRETMKEFPFRQIRSSKYLYALSKYQRFSY